VSEEESSGVQASVVMPVRNAATSVEEQLSALAQQTFDQPWELIVVDDGSTDSTGEIVSQWAGRFANFQVVSSAESHGVAHARNKGTRVARGRLIAYCDGDDVVSAQWLTGLVSALEDNDIATGPRDLSKLNPESLYRWRRGTGWDLPRWRGYLAEVSGSNMGVRRDAFDTVGGFDEALLLGADTDFGWRIQLGGGTVGFSQIAVVHYRMRRGWSYFRRYVGWGALQPAAYLRFRNRGMQRQLGRGVLRLAAVAISAPLVFTSKYRYRWLTSAGIEIGCLAGSIRHRVLYL
jgi:glycosyltransferase involved in cell wall biosynthesis